MDPLVPVASCLCTEKDKGGVTYTRDTAGGLRRWHSGSAYLGPEGTTQFRPISTMKVLHICGEYCQKFQFDFKVTFSVC